MTAKFRTLDETTSYDIIDAETGHWRTQGILGAIAIGEEWTEGDEAWPAGETEFRGRPVERAS